MLDMSKMPDEERFRCAAMRTNPRPATIATLALAFDGGGYCLLRYATIAQ